MLLLAPRSIGERHAVDADSRMHPGPDRLDVADDELAPGRLLDRPRNRPAQGVQPEEKKEEAGDENDAEDSHDPLQGPHGICRGKLRALTRGAARPAAASPSPWPPTTDTTRGPFLPEGCRWK